MVIGASSDPVVHSTRRGPTNTLLYRVAPLCAFSGGCLSCGIILYGPKRHGHDLLPYTSLRCHVIIRVLTPFDPTLDSSTMDVLDHCAIVPKRYKGSYPLDISVLNYHVSIFTRPSNI
ncbi:hypothetical protein BHM03_00044324 [Ensete ventricosum]|nr:hypothetical protein BHM03_00044324 [Ensete ventricosum]